MLAGRVADELVDPGDILPSILKGDKAQ